jgi:hypothetical protein
MIGLEVQNLHFLSNFSANSVSQKTLMRHQIRITRRKKGKKEIAYRQEAEVSRVEI